MDRLSVSLAISRGRRLYHGQPFVVFALDLRDPLGSLLARVLHQIGDARDVEGVRRRAEDRDRAPTLVVPSSVAHARKLVRVLDETPNLGVLEGCTAGDVSAVRAFVRDARSARGWAHGVSVFLAADEERSTYRFPLHRRGVPPALRPQGPLLFAPLAHSGAASANDTTAANDDDDDGDDDDDLDLEMSGDLELTDGDVPWPDDEPSGEE